MGGCIQVPAERGVHEGAGDCSAGGSDGSADAGGGLGAGANRRRDREQGDAAQRGRVAEEGRSGWRHRGCAAGWRCYSGGGGRSKI